MSEKSENGVSPPVGIVLMVAITLILAGVIAAFVFGMSGNITRIPFKMTINDSEKDHIDVYVSNVTTQRRLPNVQIGIYGYDKDTLLAGPLYTDESGLVFFEIPDGFPDHFRVQGTYKGITYPYYVDRRPMTIRISEFLGSPLFSWLLGIFGAGIAGFFAYLKRENIKLKLGKIKKRILDKIIKGKDEL
jgi:flagellin-like protein